MSDLKTQKTNKSVNDFIDSIEDDKKREDSKKLYKLMKDASGVDGAMWGESIIGFGQYHYKYATGREGDWFRIGFSPRKQNMTIYVMKGFDDFKDILKDLGKFKTSVSCLYVKKIEDIDFSNLEKLLSNAFTSPLGVEVG